MLLTVTRRALDADEDHKWFTLLDTSSYRGQELVRMKSKGLHQVSGMHHQVKGRRITTRRRKRENENFGNIQFVLWAAN